MKSIVMKIISNIIFVNVNSIKERKLHIVQGSQHQLKNFNDLGSRVWCNRLLVQVKTSYLYKYIRQLKILNSIDFCYCG